MDVIWVCNDGRLLFFWSGIHGLVAEVSAPSGDDDGESEAEDVAFSLGYKWW